MCEEKSVNVNENYAEILTTVLADIALGLVFAALGTWSTISEIFRATSKKADRFIRLDK